MFVQHISHISVFILINGVGKVHKSGSVGCGLNCVKQLPTAQEIPILRNDKFKFKGKFKSKVLLALRASGMVI